MDDLLFEIEADVEEGSFQVLSSLALLVQKYKC